MQALNTAQVAALLAPPAQKSSRAKKRAWIREDDGSIVIVAKSSVKARDFLKFEGKQGSRRRSTKGRTVIMPNGYRKYDDSRFDKNREVLCYSA